MGKFESTVIKSAGRVQSVHQLPYWRKEHLRESMHADFGSPTQQRICPGYTPRRNRSKPNSMVDHQRVTRCRLGAVLKVSGYNCSYEPCAKDGIAI